MVDPSKLRPIREKAEEVLRRTTERSLGSAFTYSSEPPETPIQFWEYELCIWEQGDIWHRLHCGCFTGRGTFQNRELDPNVFYSNNDRLLAEVQQAVESGLFDDLIQVLIEAERVVGGEGDTTVDCGASIALNSYVAGGDNWIQGVCSEDILIIHIDENRAGRLTWGCMQSERYRIRVPSAMGFTHLRVPFDKVHWFRDHERLEGGYPEGQTYFEYQVALSFAGEDRPYVLQVARCLRQKRIRVFYDEYEVASLWGKDLYVHLSEVYQKRARYCVVFLSCHYKEKLWTNHERASAQARAFQEREEYILPVRLDSTEIPGINRTIGYVEKLAPGDLAELIYRKLYGLSVVLDE